MSDTPNDDLSFRGKPLREWLQQFDKSQESATRAQLANLLGEIGAALQAWLPILRASLKATVLTDRAEAVRTAAVQSLVRLGPQTSSKVPALIDTLKDDLPHMRLNAAHALRELGPEALPAVPALISATLHDPEFRVRLGAATALWKLEHKHYHISVPVLVEALSHDDEVLRWIAADCLGEIGPDAAEAIPALKAALTRPFKSPLIRMSLELALHRIEGLPT